MCIRDRTCSVRVVGGLNAYPVGDEVLREEFVAIDLGFEKIGQVEDDVAAKRLSENQAGLKFA